MTANALVQARVDADVKERAGQVLGHLGLTLSDAVRILLTRIANEGALPFGFTADPEAHDIWFRAKVMEALNDSRPPLSREAVEVAFAKRHLAALAKAAKDEA